MPARRGASADSAPAVKANPNQSQPGVWGRQHSLVDRLLPCTTVGDDQSPQARGPVRLRDVAVTNEAACVQSLQGHVYRKGLTPAKKLLELALLRDSPANVGHVYRCAPEGLGDGVLYACAGISARRATKG